MKTILNKQQLVKVFYIIGIFFITKNGLAQGNLQFNQVINQSGSYTVPANKVFKLESISMQLDCYITIGVLKYVSPAADVNYNGANLVGVCHSDGSNGMAFTYAWPFPIWLKAGQVIQFTCTSSSPIIGFSGIEFNIVP